MRIPRPCAVATPAGSQPWLPCGTGCSTHDGDRRGEQDGTLPPEISLQHVWLAADGRAVLLDEPQCGKPAPETFSVAEPAGLSVS